MHVLIIDCGSTKTPFIASMLHGLGATSLTVPLSDLVADDIKTKYDGVVISGAPILLSQNENAKIYTKKFVFIRGLNIPILGICFGHQILGLVYQAEVVLCSPNRVPTLIKVHRPHDLFVGIKNLVFEQDHTECLTRDDRKIMHIASSPHCTFEAIKILSKPFFGVQFHPETSGESGRMLFANFLKVIEKRTEFYKKKLLF